MTSGSKIFAGTRGVEACRVGQVIGHCAELEALEFRYFEGLVQRRVDLEEPVIVQNVPAGVTVSKLRRKRESVRLIR